MDRPSITLREFPLSLELDIDFEHLQASCDPLLIALRERLGVTATANPMWRAPMFVGQFAKARHRVGLFCHGTKRKSVNGRSVEMIHVSIAGFLEDDATPVFWTAELSGEVKTPTEVFFSIGGSMGSTGSPQPLDAQQKKALKAHKRIDVAAG